MRGSARTKSTAVFALNGDGWELVMPKINGVHGPRPATTMTYSPCVAREHVRVAQCVPVWRSRKTVYDCGDACADIPDYDAIATGTSWMRSVCVAERAKRTRTATGFATMLDSVDYIMPMNAGSATYGELARFTTAAAQSRLKGRATATGTSRTSWGCAGVPARPTRTSMGFATTWTTVLGRTMDAGCATVQGRCWAAAATTFRKGSAIATATCWMRSGRAEDVREFDLNGDGICDDGSIPAVHV